MGRLGFLHLQGPPQLQDSVLHLALCTEATADPARVMQFHLWCSSPKGDAARSKRVLAKTCGAHSWQKRCSHQVFFWGGGDRGSVGAGLSKASLCCPPPPNSAGIYGRQGGPGESGPEHLLRPTAGRGSSQAPETPRRWELPLGRQTWLAELRLSHLLIHPGQAQPAEKGKRASGLLNERLAHRPHLCPPALLPSRKGRAPGHVPASLSPGACLEKTKLRPYRVTMSALAASMATLRGSFPSSSLACWFAPLFRKRHTCLFKGNRHSGQFPPGKNLGEIGRCLRRSLPRNLAGPPRPEDLPSVPQNGGVVERPSALGVSQVHVGPVLEEELTSDQGALRGRRGRSRLSCRPAAGLTLPFPKLAGLNPNPGPLDLAAKQASGQGRAGKAHPTNRLDQRSEAALLLVAPVDLCPLRQGFGHVGKTLLVGCLVQLQPCDPQLGILGSGGGGGGLPLAFSLWRRRGTSCLAALPSARPTAASPPCAWLERARWPRGLLQTRLKGRGRTGCWTS